MAMAHREQVHNQTFEKVGSAETKSNSTDKNAEDDVTSSQLLALVLGETLNRSRVDATHLIDVLRSWRGKIESVEFDQSLCQEMVTQVLHYRLGCDIACIPLQLREEVGEVLWNDPYSKSRLTRLWTALEPKA